MTKTPLPELRAAHLRHGINLSHWFSQAPEYTMERLDSHTTPRDIALIAEMGFDHVRFPIAPEPIMDADDPAQLPGAYMTKPDAAVAMMLDHGLAVIVDMHPEGVFKKNLAESDTFAESFIAFWEAFAAHFVKFDSERIFFEILNEPAMRNPRRWNTIQNRAAEAIRRSSPSHTIIISGDQCSQLSQLPLLEPPEDGNVICNFHMYEPLGFTHQGAGWSPPWAQFTKGLTYPADPAFVRHFLRGVSDKDAVRELGDYEREGWNAAHYEGLLAEATAWGHSRGRVLTCNEFGVYKTFALRASRLAWLRDTSNALGKHGIGFTMWDYAGDFAVVHRNLAGDSMPDQEVLEALCLVGH